MPDVKNGDMSEKLNWLARMVSGDPGNPDLRNQYASALWWDNQVAQATEQLDHAIRLRPRNLTLRLNHISAALPRIYRSRDQIATCRQDFLRRISGTDLDGLDLDLDKIGKSTSFNLAYPDGDIRLFQSAYGDLLNAIAARCHPRLCDPDRVAGRRPERLAILSGHVRDHASWMILAMGWLRAGLFADREVLVINCGGRVDAITDEVGGLIGRAVVTAANLRDVVDRIEEFSPGVIFYPEIGMNFLVVQAASLRLAPVQVTSWGHPVTSGLSSIDRFITSQSMETAGSKNQYREHLIAMPHSGVTHQFYENSQVPATGCDYLCAQNLAKITPEMDDIFCGILLNDPGSKLGLFAVPDEVAALHYFNRLGSKLLAVGVNPADRVVIHRQMPPAHYRATLAGAGVILDTVGWSGGNTTLDALSVGRPIVTRCGDSLRANHAQALMQDFQGAGAIVDSDADYVAGALRLRDGMPVTGHAAGRSAFMSPHIAEFRAARIF